MVASDAWNDQVRDKLVDLLKDEPENLIRIFFYLINEEEEYRKLNQLHFLSPNIPSADMEVPPVLRALKSLLNAEEAFKLCVARLVEDTKRAEHDVTFRETMNQIYAEMMDHSEVPLTEEEQQSLDLAPDIKVAAVSLSTGFFNSWSSILEIIPVATQQKMLGFIAKYVSKSAVAINSVDGAVSLTSKISANVVVFALAGVYLTYNAFYNIYRWYNKKITGKRCVKNIVDSLVSVGAGVAGGFGGAVIGSILGPGGSLVGSIFGAIIASQTATIFIDRLTQTIFGIPQEEALENAYVYFGVKMTAPNSEINTAFRQKCLKHHPDKGGKSEDFYLVQLHMSIIKLARGT